MAMVAESVEQKPVPEAADRRLLMLALFVSLSYYLGARLGLALTFQPNPISTLWPPNAIVLAALLLAPIRQWPIILLAAFPAHIASELESGVPTAMVLAWFLSNCSEALIGAALVRSLLGDELRFDSLHHAVVFIACGGLLAPLASSFLDAALVVLVGWGSAGYWQLWIQRASSNILTELAIVPVIVSWARSGNSPRWSSARAGEAMLLAVSLAAVNFLAFGVFDWSNGASSYIRYLPVPLLLWAALSFGPRGASAAFLCVTLTAIWGALHDKGPFLSDYAAHTARSLQLFLTVMAMAVMLLAAAIREREYARRELTHLTRVALLGELAGAIAHELRRPLGAILSNAQATQRAVTRGDFTRQEVMESLKDIVDQDLRAAQVIRGLRAMMKNGEPERAPVDVNRLVREVVELARSELHSRRVRVETDLAPGLPSVSADQVQLAQVVLNILVNACEEMAGSEPSDRFVKVSTRASSAGIVLRFEDGGPGFAREHAEKLFEAFYSTKESGLGLGLWLCRAIIAAHGGRIWAESPGKGAIFHVRLPAAATGE
jgi:signal transduction histidine kinase